MSFGRKRAGSREACLPFFFVIILPQDNLVTESEIKALEQENPLLRRVMADLIPD